MILIQIVKNFTFIFVFKYFLTYFSLTFSLTFFPYPNVTSLTQQNALKLEDLMNAQWRKKSVKILLIWKLEEISWLHHIQFNTQSLQIWWWNKFTISYSSIFKSLSHRNSIVLRSVCLFSEYSPTLLSETKMIDIFCLENCYLSLCSHAFVYLPENWLLFFIFYLVIVHKLFSSSCLASRMEW